MLIRRYNSKSHFRDVLFHKGVTETDEAFVWQIMKYYYPQWTRMAEDSSSISDEGSSKKRGELQRVSLKRQGKQLNLIWNTWKG
jgi:hypothetical protein